MIELINLIFLVNTLLSTGALTAICILMIEWAWQFVKLVHGLLKCLRYLRYCMLLCLFNGFMYFVKWELLPVVKVHQNNLYRLKTEMELRIMENLRMTHNILLHQNNQKKKILVFSMTSPTKMDRNLSMTKFYELQF